MTTPSAASRRAIHYGSTGQVDWTLDYASDTLTEYAYDAAGQTVETLTRQVVFGDPQAKSSDSFLATDLLTASRTLYDAEGRAVVSVGPYACDNSGDPAAGTAPVGTETVYNALGQVIETRRWADVRIQTYVLENPSGDPRAQAFRNKN